MNISLDTILSQMEDGEQLARLFDLGQSPQARWQALQDLIASSPKWKGRVKWCLAMKREGESDGQILDWLINDLELEGPFGIKLNARLLRSTLSVEQIKNYEEGFGWLLSKQVEHEASKPKKLKARKKKLKR